MNIKVFNIRLAKEFFQEDQAKMNAFLDSVEVKLASANFVTTGSVDFWSATVFYLPKNSKSTKPEKATSAVELTPKENEIFNALRQWRNELAQTLDSSAFRICHNSHLIAVAQSNPQTLEELERVSGFGKARTEKFGEEILAVLNAL